LRVDDGHQVIRFSGYQVARRLTDVSAAKLHLSTTSFEIETHESPIELNRYRYCGAQKGLSCNGKALGLWGY
jgi:hypothetical protein